MSQHNYNQSQRQNRAHTNAPPEEGEESVAGRLLRSIFGPIIGTIAIGLLGILLFGGVIVLMMVSNTFGSGISGQTGWLLMGVAAYLVNRIVRA